jgi:menaquinone-dependent protoporphyrinogen oxidase
MTILVTHSTFTGSTAGVAEAIGRTLTDAGHSAVVRPMADVTDLSPYSAVVAGSAIQGSAWLPEAVEWVRVHQDALRARPFAAFFVCITLAMRNEGWRENAELDEWLAPVRALVPLVSEGRFAGILAIDKVPHRAARWGFRASVMGRIFTEGDHRDWDAIQAWAAELPVKLAPGAITGA